MSNKVECPQCVGAKEIMVPKETKGFKYEKCTLCNGTGEVTSQLASDFIFAMNEDNFDDDEY